MSKSTKIVVSFLIVAGFVCLAIGTIFACDYISQSNSPVALSQERVIVASANRYSMPNVKIDKPLHDFVVPDSMVGTWNVNFDYLPDLLGYPESGIIFSPTSESDPNSDLNLISIIIDSQVHYFRTLVFFFDGGTNFVVDAENDTGSDFYRFSSSFSFQIIDPTVSFYFYSSGQVFTSLPFPNGFLTLASSFGVGIVGDLVGILTSGLVGIGQGLGEALSPIATAIFVNTAGDGLSVFGILIAVFAAISLGLTFTRFVLNFVTSWGNRNR